MCNFSRDYYGTNNSNNEFSHFNFRNKTNPTVKKIGQPASFSLEQTLSSNCHLQNNKSQNKNLTQPVKKTNQI